MKSKNITVTDSRLLKALNRASNASSTTALSKDSEMQDIKITTGTITKFYYDWDKAEVKTKEGNLLLCNLTHPVSGSTTIVFTPYGELKWDKNRRRTYFDPVGELLCIILSINNKSFILAYYFNENAIALPTIVDPAVLHLASYDNYIQLGGNSGGMTIDTSKVIFKDYTSPELRNKIETSDLNEDNLTNKDYYTKEEVDELLNELKEELLKENNDG